MWKLSLKRVFIVCVHVCENSSFVPSSALNPHLAHLLSSCRRGRYLLLCLTTMTLSPSLAPAVLRNPSLSLSAYFSPSPMQHHSSSSGSALLSHLSSRLAITAYLPPTPTPTHPLPSSLSCREHQMLSALSGTMATRKLDWMNECHVHAGVQKCMSVRGFVKVH